MTRDEVREWLTSDEAVVVLCRNRAMVPDDMTFVPTPNTACVARGHLRALADALPEDTAPETSAEPEAVVPVRGKRQRLEVRDGGGNQVVFRDVDGLTYVLIGNHVVRLSPEAQDEIARWLVPGNDAASDKASPAEPLTRVVCVECGERVKHVGGAWICPTHHDRGHVRAEVVASEARTETERALDAAMVVAQGQRDEARRECDQLREDLRQAEQDAVAAGDRADQAERELYEAREVMRVLDHDLGFLQRWISVRAKRFGVSS